MTDRTKLDGDVREAALTALTGAGWSVVDGRDAIEKTFRFASFVDAMGWMTRAAFHAEAIDHHPEWSNVYNRVTVVLTTHDADGLTGLDVDLAKRFDAL